MKVLNVMSRFNIGGTAQWLYQLSNGLSDNAIDNLLIVGKCPKHEKEDPRIEKLKYKTVLGLSPKSNLIKTIKAFFILRKIIKTYNPDIINTHTSRAGLIGRLAAVTVNPRPKIVHTFHGHVLAGYFNPIISNLIISIERFLARFTDMFFISGEKVKEDLVRVGVIKHQAIMQVWPGVPDLLIDNSNDARSKYGIGLDRFVVGSLGRKAKIKRLDRVLSLAIRNPDILFFVAGDGPDLNELYPEIYRGKDLPNLLEKRIMSPSEMWAIADVCLLTSDNEAIPIAPIEASLAKVPVVATDVGSTSEAVANDLTGFVCKPEIELIEKSLIKLSENPHLRKKMGDKGRQISLVKFNPIKSVNQQLLGYRNLL